MCVGSKRLVYDWRNFFPIISENVFVYSNDYMKSLESILAPLLIIHRAYSECTLSTDIFVNSTLNLLSN